MALFRRLGLLRQFLRSSRSSPGRSPGSSSPGPHSGRPNPPSKLLSLLILPAAGLASGLAAATITVSGCEKDTAGAADIASQDPPTHPPRILPDLQIFIGYDTREHIAYEICRSSILKHASLPVSITPIKQSELRAAGLYTRTKDPTESTEFSFTRFLTPFLAGYSGWAMFVDCDFLYTADIRGLIELIDQRFAVMCVQHDYTPKSATKMDGVVQTSYPRKNWSSMVLYNCGHEKNRILTPAVVSSQTGAFLHRFQWLDDSDIGSVPFTWNFLVGHNNMPPGGDLLPKAIHYTSGGPWFDAWKDCEYSELWLRERDEFLSRKIVSDRGEYEEEFLQRQVQNIALDPKEQPVLAVA